jgi:hypothetical protein
MVGDLSAEGTRSCGSLSGPGEVGIRGSGFGVELVIFMEPTLGRASVKSVPWTVGLTTKGANRVRCWTVLMIVLADSPRAFPSNAELDPAKTIGTSLSWVKSHSANVADERSDIPLD